MKTLRKIFKLFIVLIIIGVLIFLIFNSIKVAKDANNNTLEYKTNKKIKKSTKTNKDQNKNIESNTIDSKVDNKNNNNNNTNINTNTEYNKSKKKKDTDVKIKYETAEPLAEYSCSDGSNPDSSGYCDEVITADSIIGYYCENGNLEDDKCNIDGNYVDAQLVMICPTYAYELIDDTCYMHQRKKATYKMKCPEGFSFKNAPDDKNIFTCIKIIE